MERAYYNDSSVESKPNVTRLSHKKVMLILHYLGMLDKLQSIGLDKKDEAQILSDIIGFSKKNTQTFTANMGLTFYPADDDVAMTYKNLEFAKKYFQDLGLTSIVDEVEEDLSRSEADKK